MPWVTIAIWLVTYFLSSKKEGVSKGQAALMATGAAGAAYYLVDPANPDNLAGFKYPESWGLGGSGTSGSGGGSGTLPSWVVPAVGGAAVGATLGGTLKSLLPWAIGGVVLYYFLTRDSKEDQVVRIKSESK